MKKRNNKPARANHACLHDGSPRYADKPYTTKRPRPISIELLEFYQEEREKAEALKLQ